MMSDGARRAIKVGLIVAAAGALVLAAFLTGFVARSLLPTAPAAERPAPTEKPPPSTLAPSPSVTEANETSGAPADPTSEPEGGPPAPAADVREKSSFDLYWEVWGLIEQNFYGQLPTDEERTYGAIRGSLQALDDDYTSFIEPEATEILRSDMSGSFEGIGAYVRLNRAGQVEIVHPLEGQPAEAAGLQSGDVVLAVNGQSLEGLGLYETISMIRGPEGTAVVLTIGRPGSPEPFDVEIIRQRIPFPTVEYEMLEGNIAYVRLYDFNEQADARLRDALKELLTQQPAGLILDLRDNPGGLLGQAVAVADEFLPAGVALYERRSSGTEKVFETTDEGLVQELPLVVLINVGSASGSEIVAGAIQDRGRGTLVGETSFGKGSVQAPHTLSDNSELRITIARWFTPNDRAIHGAGLEPDIEVSITEEDQAADVDPQLEQAIEYLLAGE